MRSQSSIWLISQTNQSYETQLTHLENFIEVVPESFTSYQTLKIIKRRLVKLETATNRMLNELKDAKVAYAPRTALTSDLYADLDLKINKITEIHCRNKQILESWLYKSMLRIIVNNVGVDLDVNGKDSKETAPESETYDEEDGIECIQSEQSDDTDKEENHLDIVEDDIQNPDETFGILEDDPIDDTDSTSDLFEIVEEDESDEESEIDVSIRDTKTSSLIENNQNKPGRATWEKTENRVQEEATESFISDASLEHKIENPGLKYRHPNRSSWFEHNNIENANPEMEVLTNNIRDGLKNPPQRYQTKTRPMVTVASNEKPDLENNENMKMNPVCKPENKKRKPEFKPSPLSFDAVIDATTTEKADISECLNSPAHQYQTGTPLFVNEAAYENVTSEVKYTNGYLDIKLYKSFKMIPGSKPDRKRIERLTSIIKSIFGSVLKTKQTRKKWDYRSSPLSTYPDVNKFVIY